MPPKPAAAKPKYSEGEKILCFHGPLLYEAKCLGVEVKDGHIKYFVHYQGWNKNWDEWVGDARIMKFNAVGLQKQKELKEFYAKPGKRVKGLRKSDLLNQEYPPPEALRRLEVAATASSSSEAGDTASTTSQSHQQHQHQQASAASSTGPTGGGTKRVRTSTADSTTSAAAAAASAVAAVPAATDDLPSSGADVPAAPAVGGGSGAAVVAGKRLRIQIELPRPLKLWLADDADLVCRQRRLHCLPPPLPTHTVAGILGRFVTTQAASTGADELERERLSEFVAGVQSYFNAVLASQLLYSRERQQYAALLRSHRGALPASLYGWLHLGRLFVRLGDLLAHTKLDLKCLYSLLEYCDAFLYFLEKNIDTYAGVTSYEPPDPRLSTS